MYHVTPRKKQIYISGPMRGIAQHNKPAFMAAEELLKAQGWKVINPARNYTDVTDVGYFDWLGHDMGLLGQCTDLYMLDGWQFSTGARLEHNVARALGMSVQHAPGAVTAFYESSIYQTNSDLLMALIGQRWNVNYDDESESYVVHDSDGVPVSDPQGHTSAIQALINAYAATYK